MLTAFCLFKLIENKASAKNLGLLKSGFALRVWLHGSLGISKVIDKGSSDQHIDFLVL